MCKHFFPRSPKFRLNVGGKIFLKKLYMFEEFQEKINLVKVEKISLLK